MYLKSLVLKGFKSFADRSVLTLTPGLTAIVGPNGSGKSNISDAVLWVLGERNARNLRGQAMEDIIFSGSSARKSVSVAEVDLVLDNSDATLPVDFDEVVITRRMYRSGESEYLINGILSRRMDVLDILHDTGLGTGTHSIISQGSLDSILQSKPEDRRALIEEAAGVLKHKQRKEKSARKLAAMDNHLARVRDVAAEVNRQLGPLERKAKKAKAYEEVSGRLADLRLQLAADDLRLLQGEWEQVLQDEKDLNQTLESSRKNMADADQKVNDLSELIRTQAEGAGDLARRQRRASQVSERLETAELLLREKRRNALNFEVDAAAGLEGAEQRRNEILLNREDAHDKLAETRSLYEAASAALENASERRTEIAGRRKSSDEHIESLQARVRSAEIEREQVRARLNGLRDELSSEIAREKLVDARKTEIDLALDRAKEEARRAEAHAVEQQDALEKAVRDSDAAQKASAEAFQAREKAHGSVDEARAELRLIESEIAAIQQAIKSYRDDDPALAWLVEHAGDFGGEMPPLSQAIGAPQGLELLVERLLGEDLAALMVSDAARASSIASALASASLPGDVSVILLNDEGARSEVAARRFVGGSALVDQLMYAPNVAGVVEALLGDVVVCDTRDQAFDGHRNDSIGLRFASRDGCVVWPSGKVKVYGAVEPDREGVLARERRLETLRSREKEARTSLESCECASEAADEAYRSAQAEALHASQALAEQRGAASVAQEASRTAGSRLGSLINEFEDIKGQYEKALKAVGSIKPDVENLETRIKELDRDIEALASEQAGALSEAVPLRHAALEADDEFSKAKLEEATLLEKRTYAERMLEARQRELEQHDAHTAEQRRMLARKRAAARRIQPVLMSLDLIAASLSKRERTLEDAILASENASSGIHDSASTAREEARRARAVFDDATTRMTQIRVDKGRLEVQVEAAVNTITKDCETPLDRARQMPALEDRESVQDEVYKLERRIKNMGTINPDAAAEYEAIKQRADYLQEQLSDMESARRALGKIVRVIDERMKDDFVNTFNQVNANFAETFSILFPGGSAELVLEDPDNLETTGVEVKAQPRGKRITKMMLMSGGEKSLTALALLFAVYRVRTTPFYILDEVEAALDDTNLRRLMNYLDDLRQRTQLIMITHQRRTMEAADVLFGVSMKADGVTKVISQQLDRAVESAD